MQFTNTTILTNQQKSEIVHLWNNEYPVKVGYSNQEEFDNYLAKLSDKHHILLTDEAGIIRGWLAYFIRNEDRWFAMILDSAMQGRGLGSKFLSLAKERNVVLNGWVIDHDDEVKRNGKKYESPIKFYEKNGFAILAENKLENEKFSGIQVQWKKG